MDIKKLYCWITACVITIVPVASYGYFATYQAQQAYARNDVQKARECLGAAVACDTNNWRALFNLGTIALNECEYVDAIKHFDKVLEINPHLQEARDRRDAADKLQKEKDRAEEEKQKQEQNKKQQQEQAQDNQKQEDEQKASDKQQENEKDHKGQEEHQTESQGKSETNDMTNNTSKESQAHEDQQQPEASKDQETKLEQQEKNNKGNGEVEKQKRDVGSEVNPAQHAVNPEQIKDGWDSIQLTKREKEIVGVVEDTDKAAQQYMLMGTRKARQHGSQKDW
jgi:tetratricopeptide (TPR) repeat protein